jgi:trk system potassium uptake protein TrkA
MKQFAIIGLGRFGSSIAKTLYQMGHDVLAIDNDPEEVQEISDYVTHAVQADATDEVTLNTLGIRNFDVAVVTIGTDIQSSIMITLLCKEMGVKYVLAKAQNEIHAKVLYRIGADKVVFPERDMGSRVAHNLVSSNILDYIELAPDYSLVEIVPNPEWEGKNLRQLNIRAKYGVNVIAIKREDGKVNVAPQAEDIVEQNDILVVIGNNDDIKRMEEKVHL